MSQFCVIHFDQLSIWLFLEFMRSVNREMMKSRERDGNSFIQLRPAANLNKDVKSISCQAVDGFQSLHCCKTINGADVSTESQRKNVVK